MSPIDRNTDILKHVVYVVTHVSTHRWHEKRCMSKRRLTCRVLLIHFKAHSFSCRFRVVIICPSVQVGKELVETWHSSGDANSSAMVPVPTVVLLLFCPMSSTIQAPFPFPGSHSSGVLSIFPWAGPNRRCHVLRSTGAPHSHFRGNSYVRVRMNSSDSLLSLWSLKGVARTYSSLRSAKRNKLWLSWGLIEEADKFTADRRLQLRSIPRDLDLAV